VNYSTDFKSIRNDVSEQEWQTRLDLAAYYRLVNQYAMLDLIYNHIIARRHRAPADQSLRSALQGDHSLEPGQDRRRGQIFWKPDTHYGINVSGSIVHGAIHKARPDVACVLHTHTRAGMAVSAMECWLLPLSQTSIRFVGHIGYHDYEGRRSTKGAQAHRRRSRGA